MKPPQPLEIVSTDERSSVANEPDADKKSGSGGHGEAVIDVSAKTWEISLLERSLPSDESAEGLFVYRNTFNLVPRSIGRFGRLKTLKFFANEIEVLPPETGDLVDLERLQLKFSSPGLSGIPFQKLKSLKELELCKVPPRPSAFCILGEIVGLKYLTRLSICHFSIRYLPPEIGFLKNLEELDLSFNKLKNLPNDIVELTALKLLRVANNKLVDLPSGISSLGRLENLDLSNNRLTSLSSLKLASMHALQYLNLQYNKLLNSCQIPSWICCNFEGNGEDTAKDAITRSLVEVDEYDMAVHRVHGKRSFNGSHGTASSLFSEVTSSSRCYARRRIRKGWKRRDYLQQRARQEHLNHSRKWKGEDHNDNMTVKMAEENKSCRLSVVENGKSELQFHVDKGKQSDGSAKSSSLSENIPGTIEGLKGGGCGLAEDNASLISRHCASNVKVVLNERNHGDDRSCLTCESTSSSKDYDFENDREENISAHPLNERNTPDEDSSSEESKFTLKSKRHSDKDLDNPKPSKFHKPVDECSTLSCKYSTESFCSTDDHLPDGFYDAGRDRPFMSLQDYEQSLRVDSREVILLDREKDEELDAIALSAQIMMSSLKRSSLSEKKLGIVDDLQRASILALFVSDCFGGSDRSASVLRMRKAVVGSNKQQPFVCTCSSGSIYSNSKTFEQMNDILGNFNFTDLCKKSLQLIKETRNSNVVPIGTLRFGVCRHRAVLMKYLCDRADPPIPCELVRGYLDFMSHAWNVILVKRGNSWARMVVDACYPTDIREESDPELFCRYIPLSRVHVPLTTENSTILGCSFPSPSLHHGTEKAPSRSVIHCKFGTLAAAAKISNLVAHEASDEEIRNFEHAFLGEVRMLGALRKHSCIVETYGHQLSSKWVPSADGNEEHRLLQSTIVMEYVEGGSLKSYLAKLSEGGEKHAPINMALYIARAVACALVEVHSKHIIHRDIKSENILIDLDCKKIDGTPVVKLSDFDRSVPLQSFLHTCCIAHLGIHPPDVCVGTPRWMAPEVVQAMHQRNPYGLEVDIWSYGCLLLELLTLQIPYEGQSESELYDLLQMKQRPRLTPKLEALALSDEVTMARSELGFSSDAEAESLKLLVDLFYQCTRGSPAERPTAQHIYSRLCAISIQPDAAEQSSGCATSN